MIGEGALSRIATTLNYIIYVQCLFEHMDSAIVTYVSIHMTVSSWNSKKDASGDKGAIHFSIPVHQIDSVAGVEKAMLYFIFLGRGEHLW